MLVTRLILILLVLLVTAVVADQRKLFLKLTVTRTRRRDELSCSRPANLRTIRKQGSKAQARDLIKQANEQANQLMAKTKPKIRQFEMNARQKGKVNFSVIPRSLLLK
jgi:hypothetical protein